MTAMSLSVTSLASGSSGNAFLVQAGPHALLVEAGLSARLIERHLRQRGVDPATLRAIVVSHEHHDHVQSAGSLARRYGLPIVCSSGTERAMAGEWDGLEVRRLGGAGLTIAEVELRGFDLPHDAEEPMGILLAYAGCVVGLATDLGAVPDHLPAYLSQADLVIVECNHDRELMGTSGYPVPIQRRILGERGHLDNLAAARLLEQIGKDGRARTIWLAHLSERANHHPRGVLRVVRNYLDMADVTCLRLHVAERDHPSTTWSSVQQLAFDGF